MKDGTRTWIALCARRLTFHARTFLHRWVKNVLYCVRTAMTAHVVLDFQTAAREDEVVHFLQKKSERTIAATAHLPPFL